MMEQVHDPGRNHSYHDQKQTVTAIEDDWAQAGCRREATVLSVLLCWNGFFLHFILYLRRENCPDLNLILLAAAR